MSESSERTENIQEKLPSFPGAIPQPSTANVESAIEVPRGTDASQSVALPPTPPPAWLWGADHLLNLMLLVLSFLLGSFVATNSDILTHLATGRLIMEGKYQIGVDPFLSVSQPEGDSPAVTWINHSWLYGLTQYLLYQNIGGAALVVVKAAFFTWMIALLLGIHPTGRLGWTTFFVIALATLAASLRTFLQPITMSAFFEAVTIWCLYRAGYLSGLGTRAADPKKLWILPPLFVLWVNFDAWFVLGPVTLLLACLGSLVHKSQRGTTPSLGMITLISTAATLLNPHLLQAWTLPPELGNVLLRAGLPLPEVLARGGQAMLELEKVDRSIRVMSPLDGEFMMNAYLGYNVAGGAFALLVVLGVISFTLNGLLFKLEESTLHLGRLLLWLLLAALALTNYRLVPLFAAVAGPITALNLLDLTGRPISEWFLPKLARLASVVIMVVMLALSWPGCLNQPVGNDSRRRVAWGVHIDPSLADAAKHVAERRNADRCGNVFNLNLEFAHYCAWFAPEVRCFADFRYPLLARDIKDYVDLRELLKDRAPITGEWTKQFRSRDIDHVVLGTFTPSAIAWFEASENWLLTHGDRRVQVLAWAKSPRNPAGTWDKNAWIDRWNQLAFGKEAEASRPDEPHSLLREPPSLWDQYLWGLPQATLESLPRGVNQSDLNTVYFNYLTSIRQKQESLVYGDAAAAELSSAMLAMQAPGFMDSAYVRMIRLTWQRIISGAAVQQRPYLRTVDAGPPGLPILAVRAARQAVVDSPLDARSHLALFDTYRILTTIQEDHWTDFVTAPQNWRAPLRRIQMTTALYQASLLKPERPDIQRHLMNMYLNLNFNDLALEHAFMTLKAFEVNPPTDKFAAEEYEQFRKILPEFEADVQKRINDFDLKSSSAKNDLDRFRIACRTPYVLRGRDNREMVDQRGRGLAKRGLMLLNNLASQLADFDDDGKREIVTNQVDMLIQMGRAQELVDQMEDLRGVLGVNYLRYELWVAGALGRYQRMQEILAEIEKGIQEADLAFQQNTSVALGTVLLSSGRLEIPASSPDWLYPEAIRGFQANLAQWTQLRQQLCEIQSLRGTTALEQGDVAAARRHFESALTSAGTNLVFCDRQLAERYLHYLRQAAEKK